MNFERRKNAIVYLDSNNKELAKITYEFDNNVLLVNQTFVDKSLRGQGIAKALVDELANFARENNFKIKAICSYVKDLLKKDNSFDDIKLI